MSSDIPTGGPGLSGGRSGDAWIMRLWHAASGVIADARLRGIALTLLASIVIGWGGTALKPSVEHMLQTAVPAPAPPPDASGFLQGRVDSWKPMMLAWTIFHSPERDRMYEALQDFRTTGEEGRAGDLSSFVGRGKFQYPPMSLFPMEVLSSFGGSYRELNIVNLIFAALNILATMMLAVLCFLPPRAAGVSRLEYWDARKLAILALAGLAAATFYPAYSAVSRGNIQVWINFLFALACVAWISGRSFAAGCVIALAVTIKPQLGALLIWAALWREWRFCAGFIAVGVPILVVSLAYFGLHNHLAYLELLSQLSRDGEQFVDNQSVNGILHRLIERDPALTVWFDGMTYAPYRQMVHLATLASSLLLIGVALAPALLRRNSSASIADFASASVCFTLASPIVWSHHYGVLLPCFVIALRLVLDQPAQAWRSRGLLALAVAWLLCASYVPLLRLTYESPWNLVANPMFFGALLLLGVLLVASPVGGHRLAPFRPPIAEEELGDRDHPTGSLASR